jgi:hypothetical protein
LEHARAYTRTRSLSSRTPSETPPSLSLALASLWSASFKDMLPLIVTCLHSTCDSGIVCACHHVTCGVALWAVLHRGFLLPLQLRPKPAWPSHLPSSCKSKVMLHRLVHQLLHMRCHAQLIQCGVFQSVFPVLGNAVLSKMLLLQQAVSSEDAEVVTRLSATMRRISLCSSG